jgi:uncharacterized protein YdeI (YjbR/CyaY-like superfamily)
MATSKEPAGKREQPVLFFRSAGAFEKWLERNSETSSGLWIRIAKKDSGLKSVTHAEALDVALCHGWIDGQRKSHDDATFLQKFTPRGAKSIWSKINRAKALALIDEGRMRQAGLAAIEMAKRDGRWDAAYDSHRTAVPSEELQTALARKPKAKAFFATLNSQNRYAILFRIQTAKKSETRKKWIEKFVAMLEEGRTLYPLTRKRPR